MGKKFKNEPKKNKLRKLQLNKNSLNNISPFYFNKDNVFIYNIKLYNNFRKFYQSYNEYKPTQNEIEYLKNNINNLENSFIEIENKKNDFQIIGYFKNIFQYIKKVEEVYSKETIIIKEILENRNPNENITLLKIKEILKTKYDINISRSSIHRIVKNKLKYRYRRTLVKNKDLNKYKYKIISFIFIKIMLRAMQLNFNFIFIDESHFSLINNHYKTWLKYDDKLYYGPEKKDKVNLILAVSLNKVINYALTKKNINKENFYDFMNKTIEKLNKNEIQKTVFVMDNLSVHLSSNIKKLMKDKELKVLYTVPYESEFNPIELSFRFIKNYTYRKIYLKILDLKKDVIDILESEKIKKSLFKNFLETLKKYYNFIIKNIEFNLEANQH